MKGVPDGMTDTRDLESFHNRGEEKGRRKEH